jgi:hypothetical protein
VKVTVTAGPMEYWVQRADSESKLLQVMDALYAIPESSPCELEVGAPCAALYGSLWYVELVGTPAHHVELHIRC